MHGTVLGSWVLGVGALSMVDDVCISLGEEEARAFNTPVVSVVNLAEKVLAYWRAHRTVERARGLLTAPSTHP